LIDAVRERAEQREERRRNAKSVAQTFQHPHWSERRRGLNLSRTASTSWPRFRTPDRRQSRSCRTTWLNPLTQRHSRPQ
jgi:hypothetical protein